LLVRIVLYKYHLSIKSLINAVKACIFLVDSSFASLDKEFSMTLADKLSGINNYFEIVRLQATLGRACDFKDINLEEVVWVEIPKKRPESSGTVERLVDRKVDRITILCENDGLALVKVFFLPVSTDVDGNRIISTPKEHEIFFVIRKSLPS
jgi:hypothetical protein